MRQGVFTGTKVLIPPALRFEVSACGRLLNPWLGLSEVESVAVVIA
jgi:hypothetical protein